MIPWCDSTSSLTFSSTFHAARATMSRWPSTFEDLDIALAHGIISFFSTRSGQIRPDDLLPTKILTSRGGEKKEKENKGLLELSYTGTETQKCSNAQVRPGVFYLRRLGVAQ